MTKPLVAVSISTSTARRVMDQEAWDALSEIAEVRRNPHDRTLTEDELAELLSGAQACISGWGGGKFTAKVLDRARELRFVAYSAGSVKPVVTDAFWERGIRITSCAPAIAVDVAETTLGLMLVSIKKIWQYNRYTHQGGWLADAPFGPPLEMKDKTIGIVGASHVGRRVMELLRAFEVSILLYDPYCSAEKAKSMGAEKVDLDELMARSDIVSLHAPITEQTHHMINARNLALMKEGAILINTARGWLIDEQALIAELRKGRIFACLDVTDPEPPAKDSPLRQLDNVVLTPHIAGPVTDCTRLGRRAVEEVRRFFSGEPPLYEVTRDMLEYTA
ncbi:MAG: hydroxyacid dehydrogenase [Armatimonadota bacterium]